MMRSTEPQASLGRPQLRLLAAFIALVALSTGIVEATRFSFLRPGEYERATMELLAYRTLEEPPDVLFLGSSRIDFAFDARLVEETLAEVLDEPTSVFKCAQRGMKSWLLSSVLRDYVEPLTPNRILVLGVDLQLFEVIQHERALRQVGRMRDLTVLQRDDLSTAQRRELFGLPFRGLQVATSLPWLLRSDVRAMCDYQHAHAGEFSREMDKYLQQESALNILRRRASGVPEPVPGPREHRFEGGWFDEVERALARLSCRVLMVRTPVHSSYEELVGEEKLERFFERVQRSCAEHDFEFLDLNEEPYGRAGLDLADPLHLTEAARIRMSELFAREALAPRLRAND